MKCPRCEQENPPRAKFCLECGASLTAPHQSGPPMVSYADLQRALTEALERQTATSEILEVISRSQTDVQAVFDTIVRSAMALTAADIVALLRTDGEQIFVAAAYGVDSEAVREATLRLYPMPLDRESFSGRAILSRAIQKITDFETLPSLPKRSLAVAHTAGYRSQLIVPLLRGGEALGVIAVSRRKPGGFADAQTELLKTFADQAVIAIENVRLFKELETRNRELTEALDQQTATSEILRVISRAQTDVWPVFEAIVQSAVSLCDGMFSAALLFDGRQIELVAHHNFSPEMLAAMQQQFPRPAAADTVTGKAILEGRVIHVSDPETNPDVPESSREIARVFGYRALVSVPMLREGHCIGAINVSRPRAAFTDKQIQLLQTFADQAVIAIENVRLFKELQARNREIEDKSRQLEAASQHKSEFLANMSHELRTPLNAILGFSEVLGERMFGDLNDKQEEYLKDIHASGQHLLSLINDILDLSKVEAGRMELELSDFNLPATLDNALTLVRERAGRHGIALQMRVDDRLGRVRADERKIRQVVLNLLSNAIKFTPDGGRIDVRAVLADGDVEVSVSDTGVGIALEDQEAIFEEFRQVGTAAKKVEGTGLGLTLSRKFIELHGGRIWVESQLGTGSKFTFTIPVRWEDDPR